MMSLRVLRSWRSVSSRTLNGICASVCGSSWVAGIGLKNTLLSRNKDRIARDVVDDRGPRQRFHRAADHLHFDAAVHDRRRRQRIDRKLCEAKRVECSIRAAERMPGIVEECETQD